MSINLWIDKSNPEKQKNMEQEDLAVRIEAMLNLWENAEFIQENSLQLICDFKIKARLNI